MQPYNEIQLHFMEQCMIGDECKVVSMLNANVVDITYRHPINGWTALHWAARRGHQNICLLLLKSGFSREVKDSKGRTPWEVCTVEDIILREILQPELPTCEGQMPVSGLPAKSSTARGKRRCSADIVGNNRFVPNYIRHPSFPYSKTSSLDYDAKASLSTSTSETSYYSYGRRDSLKKTRFLLVRTCFSDGKEAFKRVTLPGGSSLMQLKKIVERSVRKGEVDAILTLPDRVLVDDDAQVSQFSDCQKIDVIYKLALPHAEPVGERTTACTAVKSAMDTGAEEVSEEKIADEMTGSGGSVPDTLLEQHQECKQSDSINVIQEDRLLSEDNIPPQTIPDTNVDILISKTNGDRCEVEPLDKASLRKSFDSEPGDFVKINGADNGNSDMQNLSSSDAKPSCTPDVASTKEVEEEDIRKSQDVEQSEEELDENSEAQLRGSGLLMWMNEHPTVVRCATAAAVMGVAGCCIGCIIYARRIRYGGV